MSKKRTKRQEEQIDWLLSVISDVWDTASRVRRRRKRYPALDRALDMAYRSAVVTFLEALEEQKTNGPDHTPV